MDDEFDRELERRLERMESPGGGGMVQSNLPWIDVIVATGGLIVVSALLLWWAF